MDAKAHLPVVFVIGPDDPVYGRVFSAIQEALEDHQVIDWREVAKSGSATSALVQHLHDAQVVIADLRGNEPNVFYEVGVAHTFGTPVICISADPGSVPFDLADIHKIVIVASDGKIDRRDDFMAEIRAATTHALQSQQSTPVAAAGLVRRRVPQGLEGMADALAIWETLARKDLIPQLLSRDVGVDVDVLHTKHGSGRIVNFSRSEAGHVRVTVQYLSGRRDGVDVPSRSLYLAELDAVRP